MNLAKMGRIEFVETLQAHEARMVRNGCGRDFTVNHTNKLLDEIIADESQPANLRENARFYKAAAVRINE